MHRLKRILEDVLTWAILEFDLGHSRLCKHDALRCQERCSWTQISDVSSVGKLNKVNVEQQLRLAEKSHVPSYSEKKRRMEDQSE